MQTDPIGLEGGMNLYAYVAHDPANFVDPDGLQRVSVDIPVFNCHYQEEQRDGQWVRSTPIKCEPGGYLTIMADLGGGVGMYGGGAKGEPVWENPTNTGCIVLYPYHAIYNIGPVSDGLRITARLERLADRLGPEGFPSVPVARPTAPPNLPGPYTPPASMPRPSRPGRGGGIAVSTGYLLVDIYFYPSVGSMERIERNYSSSMFGPSRDYVQTGSGRVQIRVINSTFATAQSLLEVCPE